MAKHGAQHGSVIRSTQRTRRFATGNHHCQSHGRYDNYPSSSVVARKSHNHVGVGNERTRRNPWSSTRSQPYLPTKSGRQNQSLTTITIIGHALRRMLLLTFFMLCILMGTASVDGPAHPQGLMPPAAADSHIGLCTEGLSHFQFCSTTHIAGRATPPVVAVHNMDHKDHEDTGSQNIQAAAQSEVDRAQQMQLRLARAAASVTTSVIHTATLTPAAVVPAAVVSTPTPTTTPTASSSPVPLLVSNGAMSTDCSFQGLQSIPVIAPRPALHPDAAASFALVRADAKAQIGVDVLGTLDDVLRAPDYESTKPGVASYSWHKAGRAIDLNIGGPFRVIQEPITIHGTTYEYSRVFVGNVDLTAIFLRHGWQRIPTQEGVDEWWHFEYHPGLDAWAVAMRQVWPLDQLVRSLPHIPWQRCPRGPLPAAPKPMPTSTMTPTMTPTATPTQVPTATPTSAATVQPTDVAIPSPTSTPETGAPEPGDATAPSPTVTPTPAEEPTHAPTTEPTPTPSAVAPSEPTAALPIGEINLILVP